MAELPFGSGPIAQSKTNPFPFVVNKGKVSTNPQVVKKVSGGGGGGGGGGSGGLKKEVSDPDNPTQVTALRTGGDGSGGSYSAPTPIDPLAEERAMFNRQLPNAMKNINQNASEAFQSGERTLKTTAENLYEQLFSGQQSITRARENTELSRLNGVQDVLQFVRDGMKSGASQLSTMNALDSSASEALARGFSESGGKRVRGVNNEAFLSNRGIDDDQAALNRQTKQSKTEFVRMRDEMVNTIGSQARQQLADLDQKAQGLSLADSVKVDQEKARIISEGRKALDAVESWLETQMGGVSPTSVQDIRRTAAGLQTGGWGGNDPFSLAVLPGGMGSNANQLPIYTGR